MQEVTITFETKLVDGPAAGEKPVKSVLELGVMSTAASLQVQSDLLAVQAVQLARQAEKEGVKLVSLIS